MQVSVELEKVPLNCRSPLVGKQLGEGNSKSNLPLLCGLSLAGGRPGEGNSKIKSPITL